MTPYRVLATGWREWPETHRPIVWRALDRVAWEVPRRRIVVVHGKCPYGGVDLWADQWARQEGRAEPEEHPAEGFGPWPACGPKRNSHMVNLGADLCLAFPGPNSRGTWDCVRKAVDADIPTRVTAWCNMWAGDWAAELDLPEAQHA